MEALDLSNILPFDTTHAYEQLFTHAIREADLGYVAEAFTPGNFPLASFGEIGRGHILATPPKPGVGTQWSTSHIDPWMLMMSREGYKPSQLGAGLVLAKKYPTLQTKQAIILWGARSLSNHCAFLYTMGEGNGPTVRALRKSFNPVHRDTVAIGGWDSRRCVFLMERI